MLRSSFTVDRVTKSLSPMYNGVVFIVDDNRGGMSVTNDAEAVVLEVLAKYPNHQIIYRDSEGRWDELLHWNGQFAGFRPYSKA